MNERIQELEKQAIEYSWNQRNTELDLDAIMREKFAELIVKEVLDEVLQAMDDGMDVYDTVADKFGVEE